MTFLRSHSPREVEPYPSHDAGKRIRRILPDSVEFEDGTVIDLAKQDFEFFKLIKPMVWW